MFRSIKQWCIGALTTVFVMGATDGYAAGIDGGALFKAKCATCHQPHKDGTGPKLYQVRQAWEAGGAGPEAIYQWVANWSAAAASDKYAAGVQAKKPTAMSQFPELAGKKDEINAIFDYIDAQPDPAAAPADGGATGAAAPGAAGVEEQEDGLSWIWIVLGVVFVSMIFAVGGVRRQLNNASKLASGESVDDTKSFGQEFKSWAWKYKRYVGIGGLVVVMGLIVMLFLAGYSIGVVEDYQPSQPIAFPHTVHAGKNGIDCKYCHNSVTKSKSAGLPTVNVCMNCHKQIAGNTPEQQAMIAKIYEAAGWDGQQYTGKTKEIVWNKVHVLPDHVYFNHSQHVTVGKIDCKQCHGPVDKYTVGHQATIDEINAQDPAAVPGLIKLTKPTLTMGWCLECHNKSQVDLTSSAYYEEMHKRFETSEVGLRTIRDIMEDGEVTVREMGGWECGKCHY